MLSTVIVDSGPLIAVANSADPAHHACLAALRTPGLRLVIPALCVAEVAYVLGRRRGPATEASFLRGLAGIDVEAPRAEDWPRIADLVDRYADFPLGATDASVVALAERHETDLLLTLDRRHFTVVKPRHRARFQLLPET